MSQVYLSAIKDGEILSIPVENLEAEIVCEAVCRSIEAIAPAPSYPDNSVVGNFTQVVHSETITNNIPSMTLAGGNSGSIILINNGTYTTDPPMNTDITIGSGIQIGNNWEVAIATPGYPHPSTSTQPTITLINETGFPLTLTVQLQDANVNNATPTNMEYNDIPSGDTIAIYGQNNNGLSLLTSRMRLEYFAYGEVGKKLILIGIITNTYNPPSLPLPQGPQGIQGIQGPQGPQGIQGPQGPSEYPTVVIFSTPTSSTGAPSSYTVPNGATLMRLSMCGGGGGGGGGSFSYTGGSGGGAGVIYHMIVRVTGGYNLRYVVGSGGTGGTAGSSSSAGTDGTTGRYSAIQISAYTVLYTGGGGGGGGSGSSQGAGGAGGAAGSAQKFGVEPSNISAIGSTAGTAAPPFVALSGGSPSSGLDGSLAYPLVTGGGGAGFGSNGIGGDAPGLGNSGYPATPSGGSLYSIEQGNTYGGWGGLGGMMSANGGKGGDGVIILEFNI